MASLVARRWVWVVAAIVVVAVGALVVLFALPKGGGGPLAFRNTGPIELRWDEFSGTGQNITVTLCNTSAADVTGIDAKVEGIEFTREGASTPSPGVLMTFPRQMTAGKCTEIGLKKAPELRTPPYRGTLVVSSPGGSIRRDFILNAPPA